LEASLTESGRSARRMSIVVLVIGLSTAIVAGFLFDLNRRTLRRLAHAEQEVRDLNQALEGRVAERTTELTRTVRELQSFAYTVAHDLRAPLRAMSGLSQLMVEDFGKELKSPGPEYLEKIRAAARRMDELIIGLLHYSGLSYSDLALGPIEVRSIAAGVVQSLEADLEKCHGRVEIGDCAGCVVASEQFLRQILANLIGNAIKFVAAGVAPRVRLWTESLDSTLRIWVEDNGIGIPPEYRERIFGVFERLNPTEDFPGTGIGLAIVRKAAGRMGGKAGMESKPGGGSRFWVELPLAVASKLQAAG
jgi:signal transduction histidine kinase